MDVHLIYESSLRARHGWQESLYRYQRCLKLLIVGDSAVRLLITFGARSAWGKATKKACPTASVLLEAKAAALYPEQYPSYLNYLQRGRVKRAKEAQAIGLASQSDRQKSDGQTGDR